MTAQLELDFSPEWRTGVLPDRTGLYCFLEVVRARDDPERRPRGSHGFEGTKRWRRELTGDPAVWGVRLAAHLKDGQARTLNRLSVELVDFTSDVTMGTTLAEALWALVEAGAVEFTWMAPILFRWRGEPEREPDWAGAAERAAAE